MRPYKYLIISNEGDVFGTDSDAVATDLAAAAEHTVVELDVDTHSDKPMAHVLDQDGEAVEIKEI